jgi:hypothetical protein
MHNERDTGQTTGETVSYGRRDGTYNSSQCITSRILIVDMLNKVVPTDMVTGIFVNHAHRTNETSMESFILRLFREENKVRHF